MVRPSDRSCRRIVGGDVSARPARRWRRGGAFSVLLAAAAAAAAAGDPVPVTDAVSREHSLFVGQYDSEPIADAVSREVAIFTGQYDQVTITDAVSREVAVYAFEPPPSVTDAVSRELAVFVGQYDEVLVADAVSRELAVFVGQYDEVAVADAVSRELAVFVGQYDVVAVADAVSREVSIGTGPVPSPPPNDAISREWSIGVDGPDLRLLAVLPAPSGGTDEPFSVTWFGRNSGGAAAEGPWEDEVALSSDGTVDGIFAVVGSRTFTGVLAAAESYEAELEIPAPGTPGTYWVVVTTDAQEDVNELAYEGGEQNNRRVSETAISVTQAARPDLVVAGLTPPASAPPGATVQVAWSTDNIGTAPAVGPWTEQVLLSSDDQVGGDTLLAEVTVSSIVPVGGSLSRLATVTIPPGTLPGQYWIVVTTNAGDEIIELPGDEDSAIVEICADCLLPDLVASNVSGPGAADAGASIDVQWDVANDGDGPAELPWTDRIVLLPEPGTPGGAVILEDVPAASLLPEGEQVTRSQGVVLPFGLEGTYRLRAIVDADNDVYEPGGEGNNASDAAATLVVTQPSLPDLRVVSVGTPSQAETGTIVEIAWTVTNEGEIAAAAPWVDRVYLHTSPEFDPATAELRATVTRTEALAAGATYDEPVVRQVVMPQTPATVYLTVVTDALGNVEEGIDEADNASTSLPINVVFPPRPDLRPFGLVPAQPGAAGSPVEVSWSVVNEGETPLAGVQWNERVWASSNPTIGGDILLATFVYDDALAVGESVDRTRTVAVPDLPGTWYLVIEVDATNAIFETDEGDNLAIADTPSDVLLPNLAAQITSAPSTGTAGTTISVSWTVVNVGMAPAGGSWLDTVFVQPLDGSGAPQPLGSRVRDGGLGIGGSYGQTLEGTLPPYGLGEYRLYVTTDVANAVTEDAEFDNESIGDTIMISQPPRADLKVTQITPPSDGLVGRPAVVGYRVENIGEAAIDGAATPFTDRILAIDVVTGIVRPLGLFVIAESIPAGGFVDVLVDVQHPDQPGTYTLSVVSDVANAVNEGPSGGEENNRFDGTETFTSDVYAVTVATDFEVGAMPLSSPIILTGTAELSETGVPLADVAVDVAIDVQGSRRILTAITDGEGAFQTTFAPLVNEAGAYTLRAGPPGLVAPEEQDAFTLYGMRREGFGSVTAFRNGAESLGFFALRNNGDVPMSGLTWSPPEAIPGVTLAIEPTALSFGPNQRVPVTIRAIADPSESEFGVFSRTIDFQTAEGASVAVPILIDVRPPAATLVANPGSISTGVAIPAPGETSQTLVQFQITNVGSGIAEDVQVLVPTVPWVSVATNDSIDTLSPGESAEVVLVLAPDADVPIGPYVGSIAVTGGEQTLQVPFVFDVVLDGVGTLVVSCTDEGTYYDEDGGFPLVAGTVVTVRDHFSGQIVAEGVSDATGIVTLEDVPAGYLDVQAVADDHLAYDTTLLVTPGQTVEIEAFMPISAVSYEWVVVPTFIEDEYVVTIQTEFETFVPAPVVTIDPTYVDVRDLPGDGPWTVVLTIANQGLIAAANAEVSGGTAGGISVTPLGADADGGLPLGDLAPGATIGVPVTIEPCDDGCGPPCQPVVVRVCWELVCGPQTYQYCTTMLIYDPESEADCQPVPPPGPGIAVPVGGGGGGGGPTISGPPSVVLQVDCNPCIFGCLQAAIGCVVDTSCIDAVLGCNNLFSAETLTANGIRSCAMPGLSCLGFTVGKWLSPLGKAQCLCDLINACALECRDEPTIPCDVPTLVANLIDYGSIFGMGDDGSVPEGDLLEPLSDPEREFLRRRFLDAMSLSAALWYPFGGEAFFDIADEELEIFDLWREELDLRTDPTSADGLTLAGVEQAELLGLDRPSNLTVEDLQTFFARWNRTVEYYDAGIRTAADVPEGLSTDFIDAEIMSGLWNAAQNGLTESAALGFENPYEALQFAAQALADSRIQGDEGVCARVTLELQQTVTVTRAGFDATLRIENETNDVLEALEAQVIIQTADGLPANDLFAIQLVELQGIGAIDGSQNLPAVSECLARWQLVPSNDAAPDGPREYRITGFFSYLRNGDLVEVPLFPITVEVLPNADLKFKYFLERFVFGDDPLTPDVIEPTVPFSLGLVVTNQGQGSAFDLSVTSASPEIVENELGLLVDFQLIGSQVGADPVTPSFNVNLGDFDPGDVNVARWLLTSSLQGEFVSIEATLQNLNGLDDPEFWIIDPQIDTFFMQRVVRADDAPGGFPDDMKPDFLANEIPDLGGDFVPDRLHASDGSVTPVTAILAAESIEILPGKVLRARITVDVPGDGSFHYVRIEDPFAGQYPVTGVERSDGKALITGFNAWQTDRVPQPGAPALPIRRLHLFDRGGSGEYVVTFEADIVAPQVASWASVADYAGIGRIPLPLVGAGGVFTEPRLGGPESLRVAFTEPIDPETFTPEQVRIVVVGDDGDGMAGGSVPIAWPPAISAVQPLSLELLPGGLIGEIRFNVPLPDRSRVCLRLDGVEDLAGNRLEMEPLAFGVLLGDLLQSLQVDFEDIIGVAALENQEIDPGDPVQVRADMNRDGRIDSSDIVVVEAAFEAQIRGIDEPCANPPPVVERPSRPSLRPTAGGR